MKFEDLSMSGGPDSGIFAEIYGLHDYGHSEENYYDCSCHSSGSRLM